MRLVVDTGPFIALFSRTDAQHNYCLQGYQQLVADGYELYTSFPILGKQQSVIKQNLRQDFLH